MARLGELLELIHDAVSRASPARLTVTEWRHGPRSERAWDAFTRARHASAYLRAADEPPEAPAESRWSVRLAYDSATRYREESAGRQEGVRYLVRDGARWLTWDADWGLVTSESEPEGAPPASSFGLLLDPVELVAAFRLAAPVQGSVAGRPALTVSAVPREQDHGSAVLRVGAGAEVVELAFDAETGALLRTEALRDAEPFHRIEVAEIAYGPLPPETFAVEPPEGHDGAAGRWARPLPLELHELAATAPFTVLVPERVPAGWRLGTAQLLEGRAQPRLEATAYLDYASPEGAYAVGVRERASEAEDAAPALVDHGATVAPRFVLTLVRAGTWVELSGPDGALLEELATSLVPASSEPPRLG